jgi:DNA-binding NtrC family response regulator
MEDKMLKVLLIEDSETDAIIIERALRDHMAGAECSRASTLAEGEKILQKQDTDVILLDLGLPDSASPADSYARVKKWADKIPIIISTGLRDHTIAKSLVHDGAEDYMNKDLIASNPAHVRDAVEFAVERHGLRQKVVKERNQALADSEQKDAMLGCFMGGYSVSQPRPKSSPGG